MSKVPPAPLQKLFTTMILEKISKHLAYHLKMLYNNKEIKKGERQ